jgi:hypothetical protein
MVQFGTRKDGRHYPKGMPKKAIIQDAEAIKRQTGAFEKQVVKKANEIEHEVKDAKC